MEPILQFFEQYWGYTLFGGVTVGTLVMFVIAAIKFIGSNLKLKDSNGELVKGSEILKGNISTLMSKLSEQAEKLEQAKQEMQQVLNAKVKQNEYFNKVQATTFEALSYLLMASKLPAEDKASMMKKFNELTNTTEEQLVLASENAENKITAAVNKVNEISDQAIIKVNEVSDQVIPKVEEAKEQANNGITTVSEVLTSVEKAKSLLDKYNGGQNV